MGGTISTFYISANALLTIKNNLFYNNVGDFGVALNFEHRGGAAIVSDCIFDSNINPAHPMGAGSAIKVTGDYGTQVFSMRNLFKKQWSYGTGVWGAYTSVIYDTNSTYIGNFMKDFFSEFSFKKILKFSNGF